MMLDLGDYAVEVLTAYGASLGLLGALVWVSLHRAARVKRRLGDMEARR